MIKQISVFPLVMKKMKKAHNRDFMEKEIGLIFSRPRWSTLSSTLMEFQFKLLHGIVYTNYHLYKFKFIDTNLCSFYKKEEETYKHIFYKCEFSRLVCMGKM